MPRPGSRQVTCRAGGVGSISFCLISLLGLTLLAALVRRPACSHGLFGQPSVHSVLAEPWQADYAFLIKTGSLTAQRRVPMQLLTFLSRIRNFILVGAEPDAAGDVRVLDVATPALEFLLDAARAQSPRPRSNSGSGSSNGGDGSSDGADGTVEDQAAARKLMWRIEKASRGYTMDRYKNLPGWGALHDAFPAAKWFVSIDDDAYWLMDNFRRFISGLGPDLPHYLGNPYSFKPSRNLRLGLQFEGGMMPHGGEGMILSRRAMQLMRRHLSTCLHRIVEGTYMFGDVQTRLCLRIAGVAYNETMLPFETLMLNYPPGVADPDAAQPLWGLAAQWPQQHPCARVFAIHHLLPEQMQAVFDAEAAAPDRQPTYADLWRALRHTHHPAAGRHNATRVAGEYLQLGGVQTSGEALGEALSADGPVACAAACTVRGACVQWTHDSDAAACELRSTFGRVHVPREQRQLVSGAHLGRFECADRSA